MNNRPGISRDIRPVRRPDGLRLVKPLPPDMPRRTHQDLSRSGNVPAVRSGRWQKVWEYAQYPLISVVALVSAASSSLGQLLVLVFGIAVLIRKMPAKIVFGLALIILVSIPLFQALSLPGIAENAAIYVYELLVIGTIRAILELNQQDLKRQV